MFADKAGSLPFEGTVSGEATEHYINDYLYSNLGSVSLLVTSSQSKVQVYSTLHCKGRLLNFSKSSVIIDTHRELQSGK